MREEASGVNGGSGSAAKLEGMWICSGGGILHSKYIHNNIEDTRYYVVIIVIIIIIIVVIIIINHDACSKARQLQRKISIQKFIKGESESEFVCNSRRVCRCNNNIRKTNNCVYTKKEQTRNTKAYMYTYSF